MMRRGGIAVRLGGAVTAALIVSASTVWAVPHEMTDEEMDGVCAKGSSSFNVDMTFVQQIFFQFSQRMGFVQVNGSGNFIVAAADPSHVQVQGGPGSSSAPPSATLGTAGTIVLHGMQPIQVQAVDTAVQITGNLDISVQTLPQVIQLVQKNQLLLPGGLLQQMTSSRLGTGSGNRFGLGR